MIRIDFETFSEKDITECGAWVYSKHPSTEVLCMAWAKDDEPVNLWVPGNPLPEWVGKEEMEAHNASFEISIWKHVCVTKYGFPEVPLEMWYDSMALLGTHGIPLSLEKAGAALDLPVKKDTVGKLVMLQLSKPRKPTKTRPETRYIRGKYKDWDAKFDVLFNYCKTDVEAQREISKFFPPLNYNERKDWLLTEKMNMRGMPIDVPLVCKSISILEDYYGYSKARIKEITNGELESTTEVAKLLDFLQKRGVLIENVRAGTLEDILPSVTDIVAKEVIELRLSTAKSSTAKLIKMLEMSDEDSRVRHNMIYFGAITGRVAGRGVQMTNMPRGNFDADYPDEMYEACEDLMQMNLIQIIEKYSNFIGKNGKPNPLTPLDVISSCLRGMFKAPKEAILMAADYANIEGRVNAWIAGEDWKVEAFKDFDKGVGPDLYKLGYAKAFGVSIDSVTKPLRQVGKVMELALGYGGGKGAWNKMAGTYRVNLSEEEVAKVIKAWRTSNPKICAFWYASERAAVNCLLSGKPTKVEGVSVDITFEYDKERDFLYLILPSKYHKICYYQPRLKEAMTPWGKKKYAISAMGTDSFTKQYVRFDLWYGHIVENIVQAVARDIMYEGMARAENAGYLQLLTVYDESVAEVNLGEGKTVEEFERLLCTLPDWAEGLPIASEGFENKRYRK